MTDRGVADASWGGVMGFGRSRRSDAAVLSGGHQPSSGRRERDRALYLLIPALVFWVLAGGGGGCGSLPGSSELVGFIPTPGTARDVVADPARGLAYVASDEFGLTVVDVSDPFDPIALGAPNPPFVGSHVAVSGVTAVVTSTDGIHVVDLSDPLFPTTVGILEGLVGSGIAMKGSTAYVRVVVPGNPAHTDLAVVNLSNPASPTLVRQLYAAGGDRVEVVGSYLYITTGSGIAIYDVSSPSLPVLRSSLGISGGARELAVAGNTAYVGNLNTVYSVDVTNRSSPRIVGQVATAATDLSLYGTKLYVLLGTEFRVVNVANRAAPYIQGSANGFSNSWAIAAMNGAALLASPGGGGGSGLYLADVSVPTAPDVVDLMPGVVGNSSIAAGNGLAAVSASDGLHIVDLSDPLLPETVGILEGLVGSGVAIQGSYAYVRAVVPGNPAHTDLAVVNISNPSNPTLVRQIYLPGGDRVEVVGSYVYVTTGSALSIYDISNPASPSFRSSLNIPYGARELAVSGNTVYVGNLTRLYSVDVSNRSSPRIVGSVATAATDLALSGTHLYVLLGTQFRVVNVSNPAAPTIQSTSSAFANSAEIEAVGNQVLLASHAGKKLISFDVSAPTQPLLMQEARVPGFAYSISKAPNFVYVGDSSATVDVFQLSP